MSWYLRLRRGLSTVLLSCVSISLRQMGSLTYHFRMNGRMLSTVHGSGVRISMFMNSPLPAAQQLVRTASVQAWRLASANRQLNDIEPREEQLTASGSLSHPSTHICCRCFASLGFGLHGDSTGSGVWIAILSSSGPCDDLCFFWVAAGGGVGL